MPEEILEEIPYQLTLEAIEDQSDEWEENLKKLLCNYVSVLASKIYKYEWDKFETKEDKRQVVKQLVYLDALVTLYRMPNQFNAAFSELVERFRKLPQEPLLKILEKFCKMTLEDGSDNRNSKRRVMNKMDSGESSKFKFVKSKE